MLNVSLAASRVGIGLYAGLYAVAISAIGFSQLNWLVTIVLLCCVAVYGGYILQRYLLLKTALSITHLSNRKTSWQLTNRRGERLHAHLLGWSVVTRYVMVLHFRCEGQRQVSTVLLFFDVLEEQAYRRLYLALRFP